MWAETPRIYANPDSGIPSGMPDIQEGTLLSAGGERCDNQCEQQSHLLEAHNFLKRSDLMKQFLSKIARWRSVVEKEYKSWLNVSPAVEGFEVQKLRECVYQEVPNVL